MSIVAFPASRINTLRTLAAEARRVPEDGPEGWSKSSVDPAAVLSVFKNLRLKPGYMLQAYQFRAGGNGNGIVWAIPEGSDFQDPNDCPTLPDVFLEPPKPAAALDDFMKVMDGDGSPFSYLCASVLQRELTEFGAMWHGCSWSTHTILGSDPFQPTQRQECPPPQPVTELEEWHWKEFCPTKWRPRVEQHESGEVVVDFITFSALGEQTLVRHVDTFRSGSYRFKSKEKVLATAPGGFIF